MTRPPFVFMELAEVDIVPKMYLYRSHRIFSKDDSRAGATLEFNKELTGNDWRHMGENSKGNLMYEVWSKGQSANH
ncbi:hypothetical protein [Maribacter sp. ACAM166]|uniref:hypothetical protein n=1 Tax=Maribacter sp. ACAM166 TaxID=2508996 RepID=UPI0010FD6C53|nr:hypothetical protein [Maribacter sp. ACAM166]TLP76999.1 hypothetical protein ES765_13995 [Maribacter sp. ACAM166]